MRLFFSFFIIIKTKHFKTPVVYRKSVIKKKTQLFRAKKKGVFWAPRPTLALAPTLTFLHF